MKRRYLIDRSSKGLLLICASVSAAVLLAIAVFIFKESLPAFSQIGLLDFLLPGARAEGEVLLDGENIYAPGVDVVGTEEEGGDGLSAA